MREEIMKTESGPVTGGSARLIKTPCGTVRGAVSAKGDCVVFKGIRYAEAERFCYCLLYTSPSPRDTR